MNGTDWAELARQRRKIDAEDAAAREAAAAGLPDEHECAYCEGFGTAEADFAGGSVTVDCPSCDGLGTCSCKRTYRKRGELRCSECDATIGNDENASVPAVSDCCNKAAWRRGYEWRCTQCQQPCTIYLVSLQVAS